MRTVVPGPTDELPNELEAALLRRLAKSHPNPALALQISQCRVALREYSGCGFFTTLVVPAERPLIRGMAPTLNGPDVEAPELLDGAGSVLFIKAGRLDFLEVFAYADGDPAHLRRFTLRPTGPT
jgi:hypothetical protein